MEKQNLFNITKGKTKLVIAYIENLETNSKKDKEFEKLKEKALRQTTANKMLSVIGYNYEGKDKIYNWSK
jgi:hypothetical protein